MHEQVCVLVVQHAYLERYLAAVMQYSCSDVSFDQ